MPSVYNEDLQRGRVCAFMTNIHLVLGELDEALVAGARALPIAERFGDLRLPDPRSGPTSSSHTTVGASTSERLSSATDNLAKSAG